MRTLHAGKLHLSRVPPASCLQLILIIAIPIGAAQPVDVHLPQLAIVVGYPLPAAPHYIGPGRVASGLHDVAYGVAVESMGQRKAPLRWRGFSLNLKMSY